MPSEEDVKVRKVIKTTKNRALAVVVIIPPGIYGEGCMVPLPDGACFEISACSDS
jgi:hypothetical protein